MIIIDTNVISEAMREKPDERVMLWYRSLDAHNAFTTAITEAELLAGILRLPAGKRRDRLTTLLGNKIKADFKGRILPFDTTTTSAYARINSKRRALGKPINALDAQIAAICSCHGATLATRNTKDFEDTGIIVVNPWEHTS